MIVKIQEYKGHPTFSIWASEDDKAPIVAFGLRKAQAILEVVEDLKSFVNDGTVSKTEEK